MVASGNAGNITLNLQSGGYNLYSDYYINDYKDTLVKFYRTSDYISGYQNTETTYTSIWAQSIGGGGDAGASKGIAALGARDGDAVYGSAVYIKNQGNVFTTATSSTALFAQSIGGGGGNAGSVDVINTGSIYTGFACYGGIDFNTGNCKANYSILDPNAPVTQNTNGGAFGILAQSIGGAGGNGGSAINGSVGGNTSLIITISGKGGDAADSSGTDTVTVRSDTDISITTKQDQSSGILAQSIGGSGGNGGLAIAGSAGLEGASISFALGGTGGAGGSANTVNVEANGPIKTSGALSAGIVAQSIGGGNGGSTFTAGIATSKTDGTVINVGGAGAMVTVSQGGDITTGYCDTTKTVCDKSPGIIAQLIGGGGGNGGSAFGFALQGLQSINLNVGGRGGSGGTGGEVKVYSNDNSTLGTIATTGALSNAIFAQSLGGGGGSGGYATSVSLANASPTSESIELAAAIGGAGGGGGAGGSSFSYFGTRGSAQNEVAGIAASYGAGLMNVGAGGSSSSTSGDTSLTSAAPTMQEKSYGGTAIALGLGGNGGHSGNVTVSSTSGITTTGDAS